MSQCSLFLLKLLGKVSYSVKCEAVLYTPVVNQDPPSDEWAPTYDIQELQNDLSDVSAV